MNRKHTDASGGSSKVDGGGPMRDTMPREDHEAATAEGGVVAKAAAPEEEAQKGEVGGKTRVSEQRAPSIEMKCCVCERTVLGLAAHTYNYKWFRGKDSRGKLINGICHSCMAKIFDAFPVLNNDSDLWFDAGMMVLVYLIQKSLWPIHDASKFQLTLSRKEGRKQGFKAQIAAGFRYKGKEGVPGPLGSFTIFVD